MKSSLLPSEFKYRHAVGRKIICEGVILSIAFNSLRLINLGLLLSASAILGIVTVQYQGVLFFLFHTHTVIRSGYRRKVDHKQQIAPAALRMAQEAENAAVAVIRIDPLKALRDAVRLIHSRRTVVEVEQIPDIIQSA